PLAAFEPLSKIDGVELISLQKGFGVEQIEKVAGRFPLTVLDGALEDGDGFLRTAAIMENLNLVLCPDTGVAHLAGGMGLPTWVALPTACDWRWMLDREDCAWYPTMRLFRQIKQLEWGEVFERIAATLAKMVR